MGRTLKEMTGMERFSIRTARLILSKKSVTSTSICLTVLIPGGNRKEEDAKQRRGSLASHRAPTVGFVAGSPTMPAPDHFYLSISFITLTLLVSQER